MANDNNSKYFRYKVKLLGNEIALPAPNNANNVLKNAANVAHLKFLEITRDTIN